MFIVTSNAGETNVGQSLETSDMFGKKWVILIHCKPTGELIETIRINPSYIISIKETNET